MPIVSVVLAERARSARLVPAIGGPASPSFTRTPKSVPIRFLLPANFTHKLLDIHASGRYHMFYQYLPEKCEWDFGIVWGHAYSEDLVHWEHLEPALVPSPGWVDADGCFSGCCVIGENGKPVILYTGVRLRSNHETGPLPPSDQDLGMVFIESQCAAVPADDDDDLLVKWNKLQVPFLKLPPKSEQYHLTGWRDPFIIYDLDVRAANHKQYKYHMLIGSGIKDKGGTALVYGSVRLEDGWELLGLLCEGNHANDDTGIVWECPLVVRLGQLIEDGDFGVEGNALTGRGAARAPSWLWPQAGVSKAGKQAHETISQRISSADLVLEAGGMKSGAGGATLPGTGLSRPKSNLGVSSNVSRQGTGTSYKQPGFSVVPDSNSSSASSLDKLGSTIVKKNPSISLLAQKLEQVAITGTNSTAGNGNANGDHATDAWDESSSEAPSIASRVNSAMLEDGVDSFELLKAKVKPLNVSRAITEEDEVDLKGALGHGTAGASGVNGSKSQPPEVQKFKPTDWHLFTVSPDAPTNPVLYWVGRMKDRCQGPQVMDTSSACPRFDLDNARGPFKLDLGDILYAPNVCQDGNGRWLLWGWLQERRKVGSYAYAGCLTLPRVLHVTNEGRLIQAPIPEVNALRTKERKFAAQRVVLHPETTYPIKYVRSERLDIQCSIERGSSSAAGLLFRSHEAEAEGSTAIIYDWSTNQLEAIFNVPPTWKPHAMGRTEVPLAPASGRDGSRRASEDSNVSCDPAAMLSRTPRLTSFSMDHSTFDTLVDSGRASPFSLSTVPSPGPGSPLSGSDGEHLAGLTSPSPIPGVGSASLARSGSSMAMAMQRSTSVTNLATGASYLATSQGILGTSHLGTSHLGTASQMARGLSFGNEPSSAGAGQVGPGTSLSANVGSLSNFMRTTSMLDLADMDAGDGIEDEDLGNLLEDLAAPMRVHEEEAQGGPSHGETRRVGGPLAMHPTQVLHLRIFVDHSSIEVFTGTGECLSTRIYRGRGPNPNNPGIEFVSFGGQATIDSCECYEMVSCWKEKVQTPIVRRSFDSSRRSSLDRRTEDIKFGSSRPSMGNSFIQRVESHSFIDPDAFCVDSRQHDVISSSLVG